MGYYEDCAFDYVNQFDTPECDMLPGSDTRQFAEDFLQEEAYKLDEELEAFGY